jgi:hypothetical protein
MTFVNPLDALSGTLRKNRAIKFSRSQKSGGLKCYPPDGGENARLVEDCARPRISSGFHKSQMRCATASVPHY